MIFPETTETFLGTERRDHVRVQLSSLNETVFAKL